MTDTLNLTLKQLADIIKEEANNIEVGGLANLVAAAERFKQIGIECGAHLGRVDLDTDKRACMEWFAGQLIDITNSKAHFAVNSWVNMVEKFTKFETPEEES